MTHIRTDLTLLSDHEMDDWVEDIVENTHYRDVRTLVLRLKEAIDSNDGDLTNAISFQTKP
ncbi:MAG TPA: hypothetical protein VIP29_02675 [Nitrososphaeraceae archaeon]|nr:hypothetical protein [Nitrososphaeraceae archaeon]